MNSFLPSINSIGLRNASLAHRNKETNPLLKFKDKVGHPATPVVQSIFHCIFRKYIDLI